VTIVTEPEVSQQRTDVLQEHIKTSKVNRGLPTLDLHPRPVSFFEFWPAWVFYTPVVIYWIFLSLRYRNFGLPMAVNPNIKLGGMVGESKLAILDSGGELAHRYILRYIPREISVYSTLHNCDETLKAYVDNDIAAAAQHEIDLPFVVKPELGCRGAGVRLIENPQQLCQYLREFPSDRKYLIQKLAPYSAEAGIFYERMPGEKKGRVTSITLKYRPVIVGDGISSLKALIMRSPRASILRELYFEKNKSRLKHVPKEGEEVPLAFAGSHCKGSIFRNGNQYISQSLSDKIDQIMHDFKDFHYGRLDIKFKNIEALQEARDFVIIEINGVSSEKTHIWDSRTSLYQAFATLFEQYTTLFKMGNEMLKQGYKAPSAKKLVSTWIRELKRGNDYPATD